MIYDCSIFSGLTCNNSEFCMKTWESTPFGEQRYLISKPSTCHTERLVPRYANFKTCETLLADGAKVGDPWWTCHTFASQRRSQGRVPTLSRLQIQRKSTYEASWNVCEWGRSSKDLDGGCEADNLSPSVRRKCSQGRFGPNQVCVDGIWTRHTRPWSRIICTRSDSYMDMPNYNTQCSVW